MTVTLIRLPPVSEAEHSILAGRCLIGRGEDCDLRLTDHTVSRRHAELFSGTLRLREMDSRNGTLVNRDEIAGECVLAESDVVAFGMSSFEVRVSALDDHSALCRVRVTGK